jgi:hypothetical protein
VAPVSFGQLALQKNDESAMLKEAERDGFHAASDVMISQDCALKRKKMIGSCWACRALASTRMHLELFTSGALEEEQHWR